jgi:hypothetical protein
MIYTGTTGPIGGSEIFGGGAFTMSVAIAGVTVGMSVAVSPRTFPGNGIYWTGYVSAPGVVTVKVGATTALFVVASIYDVQVNDGTGSGGGAVTAVTGVAPIASSGGTTPAISIANATTAAPGAVQPDGVTIDVAAGVISVPTATTGAKGLVEPDGTTITISGGVISAAAAGGVTAVTGTAPIVSSGGTTPAISVNAATTGAAGVVKPDGVTIDVAAGVISVPTATTGAAGLVQPDGVTIDVAAGVISVPTATTGAKGLVEPDGTTITISSGVISAVGSGALTRIAQQILGSAAASVTFSSIPATYTDLLVVCMALDGGTAEATIQFNGDTAAHYSDQMSLINNTFNSASNNFGLTGLPAGLFPGTGAGPGLSRIHIFSYAKTTFQKGLLLETGGVFGNSNGSAQWTQSTGLWASTAAINSLTITAGNGNFQVGSVFTVYGIQ